MIKYLKQILLNLVVNGRVSLTGLAFLFIFLPLLWRSGEACAQQHQVDSLQKLLLKNNDADEQQLQLLNRIVPLQVNIKPNDALANAEKAIALAQRLNKQNELAVAYNNKGFVLLRKSQYDDSNIYLKKALALNSTLKNQNGMADNQTITAEILRRLGVTDSAKGVLVNVLKICKKNNYTKGIANAYFCQRKV